MDPAPGQFRSGPVYIGGSQHVPPPAVDVPALVVDMCETINNGTDPHQMAAYAMWRMNWIHPFTNGNGRTSRAVAYLVLCAKLGFRLPGKRTVPDMIASYKNPYYKALEAADAAWAAGNLDVSVMQSLMVDLLKKQLADV
jgi:Fic family protein